MEDALDVVALPADSSSRGELSDEDLEVVVGGLARTWVALKDEISPVD